MAIKRLEELVVHEVSGVDAAANQRTWLITKGAPVPMKVDGDYKFNASAYAYTPDVTDPATWDLRIWETPDAKETAAQITAAAKALGTIPKGAQAKAKTALQAAWQRVGGDPPAILKSSWLERLTKGFAPWGNDDEDAGVRDFNQTHAAADDRADDAETDTRLYQMFCDLAEAVDSVLDDDGTADKRAAVAESLQQFLDALETEGLLSTEETDDMPDISKALNMTLSQIYDLAKGKGKAKKDDDDVSARKDDVDLDDDDISARKDDGDDVSARKDDVDLDDDDVAARKRKARKDADDVAARKGDDGNVSMSKAADKIAKEMIDLRKELADTHAVAKQERELRLDREYLAKAETIGAVPGLAVPELGKVLKQLAEKAPGIAEQVTKAFAALTEQVNKSALFGEQGRGGAGTSGSAYQQIQAQAEEMVKAGTAKNMAEGIAKAAGANPDLYTKYQAERHA